MYHIAQILLKYLQNALKHQKIYIKLKINLENKIKPVVYDKFPFCVEEESIQ
jgi:hypothetical protein